MKTLVRGRAVKGGPLGLERRCDLHRLCHGAARHPRHDRNHAAMGKLTGAIRRVSATGKRNPEQGHRVGRLGGGQDVVHRRCRLPVGPQRASSVPPTCLKRRRSTVSSGPSRIIARSTETRPDLRFSGPLLVEVMGFEPTTSSMRPKRPEWSARAVTWDFASCAARHLGGRALRVPLSGRALRPKGAHRRAAGPTDPRRHDRRRRGRARRARS